VTYFAVIAALMCVAACLILLRPLLWPRASATPAFDVLAVRSEAAAMQRRLDAGTLDAQAYASARAALAQSLLDAVTAPVMQAEPRKVRNLILATVAFVPLLSLPVYWATGAPDVLRGDIAVAPDGDERAAAAQLQERITALEQKLASAPQDATGWGMLGRSYAALGEYAKAASAFAKAAALTPADAQLLADYADALAMSQGRRLAGEPVQLLKRALAADPNNIKALLLDGTADFESGRFDRAVAAWEKVISLAPQDAELVASLRQSIDEARAKTAGAGSAPNASSAAAGVQGAGARSAAGSEAVSGRLTLAPGLAASASPADAVFVFARAAQGPRMPLAAFKLQVKDLPTDFRLDDSMAMAPQAKISSASEVIVTARISKSGDPVPRSGDLEGSSAPVKPGTGGIKLEISDVVK
jgi:cytochrome c-type biogenesis protein CcmH